MSKKGSAAANYYEPRYRRRLFFCFGVFLLIMSVVSTCAFTEAWARMTDQQHLVAVCFTLLLVWCGSFLVATSLQFRLTLTAHQLTIRRILSTKTMKRRDIAAYGTFNLPGVDGKNIQLVIFDRHKRRPVLRIPFSFDDDEAILAWFQAIPGISWRVR